MDIKKHLNSTKIYQEFDDENQKYWFDFKQKKFLHNIDTFYYSVKLVEDFTNDSSDDSVLRFRKFFEQKKSILDSRYGQLVQIFFPGFDRSLNLCAGSYAGFSVFVWNARNGLIFSLLLLFLMVLMVVSQLRLRSLYNSDLICCGCMEFMKPLNALMNM